MISEIECPNCGKGIIKIWITPSYSIRRRGFTGRSYNEFHRSKVEILSEFCPKCKISKKELKRWLR